MWRLKTELGPAFHKSIQGLRAYGYIHWKVICVYAESALTGPHSAAKHLPSRMNAGTD